MGVQRTVVTQEWSAMTSQRQAWGTHVLCHNAYRRDVVTEITEQDSVKDGRWKGLSPNMNWNFLT